MMTMKVSSDSEAGCTNHDRDGKLNGVNSCAKSSKGEGKKPEQKGAKRKISESDHDSSEDDKERKKHGAGYEHLFLRGESGKCALTCLPSLMAIIARDSTAAS